MSHENEWDLRTALYYRKKSLDKILLENKLWSDVYKNVFLKMKDSFSPSSELDAEVVLNDVYYYCIKVLIDPHSEDNFQKKYLKFNATNEYAYTHESIIVTALTYTKTKG